MAIANLRVRHYFRSAFKFMYMVYKKKFISGTKKFNNGLNGIFWGK